MEDFELVAISTRSNDIPRHTGKAVPASYTYVKPRMYVFHSKYIELQNPASVIANAFGKAGLRVTKMSSSPTDFIFFQSGGPLFAIKFDSPEGKGSIARYLHDGSNGPGERGRAILYDFVLAYEQ